MKGVSHDTADIEVSARNVHQYKSAIGNIGWFKKSCDSEYSFVGNSSGLIACIPSIQPLNYKKQKTNIGKRENKRHSLKCIRIMREMSHRVSKK